MQSSYWLLKTEPETYSYADLEKDGKINWNGVRNFQARNHLRNMKKGDIALIYHSGDERSAIGLAEVVKEAYPDPDSKKKGDWVQVDLKPLKKFKKSVPLSEIKSTPTLKDLALIRQSRLSVMPVENKHFETLLKLGETKL